jgi:hypothetical protein
MRVPRKARVATMSRSRTPTISQISRRPEKATTPTAEAMNSLSAIGSITGPNGEPPSRRATGPSSRSVAAAAATMAMRQLVLGIRRNAPARGMRTQLIRSAQDHGTRPCSPLRAGLASVTLLPSPNVSVQDTLVCPAALRFFVPALSS